MASSHQSSPGVDAFHSTRAGTVDAAVIRAAPKCKLIAQPAAGHDNIDLAVAQELGIPVTIAPSRCFYLEGKGKNMAQRCSSTIADTTSTQCEAASAQAGGNCGCHVQMGSSAVPNQPAGYPPVELCIEPIVTHTAGKQASQTASMALTSLSGSRAPHQSSDELVILGHSVSNQQRNSLQSPFPTVPPVRNPAVPPIPPVRSTQPATLRASRRPR
eukprot:21216-Chlamydomonas_euryale.AAC.8